MPRKASGQEKTYTIRQKRPNGDIYLLERKLIYDPETKQNKVLSTRVAGKIKNGTNEVVPTRPKRSGEPLQATYEKESGCELTASRYRTGMMDILAFVGRVSGIDALLYRCTDRGTAEKIISIARYLVAEDRPSLPALPLFQMTHPLPYAERLSEDVYHRLFEEVGRDESLAQNFFRGRCRDLTDWAALAYDSTAIGTYSTNQIDARWGMNKDGSGLKEIKLLVLYSVETRQPVVYTKLPGNISDVTTIQTALKQLRAIGVSKATIITDNGYYSQQNIADMCLGGFHFLTPVKTSLRWIRNCIDESNDALSRMTTACPFDPALHGTTIMTMHEFARPRRYASAAKGLSRGDNEPVRRRVYVHVFFDAAGKAEQDAAFSEQIMDIRSMLLQGASPEELPRGMQLKADKYLQITRKRGRLTVDYKQGACEDACRYHGYFVFVSNYKADTFEALRTYHRRATIELFFEIMKQQMDGNRPRVWHSDSLRGRMFVQFVALCYYEFLAQKIRGMKETLGIPNGDAKHDTVENLKQEKKLLSWLKHNSLQMILRWFDTIETVQITSAGTSKRWTTESTARDQLFLDLLGMNPSF